MGITEHPYLSAPPPPRPPPPPIHTSSPSMPIILTPPTPFQTRLISLTVQSHLGHSHSSSQDHLTDIPPYTFDWIPSSNQDHLTETPPPAPTPYTFDWILSSDQDHLTETPPPAPTPYTFDWILSSDQDHLTETPPPVPTPYTFDWILSSNQDHLTETPPLPPPPTLSTGSSLQIRTISLRPPPPAPTPYTFDWILSSNQDHLTETPPFRPHPLHFRLDPLFRSRPSHWDPPLSPPPPTLSTGSSLQIKTISLRPPPSPPPPTLSTGSSLQIKTISLRPPPPAPTSYAFNWILSSDQDQLTETPPSRPHPLHFRLDPLFRSGPGLFWSVKEMSNSSRQGMDVHQDASKCKNKVISDNVNKVSSPAFHSLSLWVSFTHAHTHTHTNARAYCRYNVLVAPARWII